MSIRLGTTDGGDGLLNNGEDVLILNADEDHNQSGHINDTTNSSSKNTSALNDEALSMSGTIGHQDMSQFIENQISIQAGCDLDEPIKRDSDEISDKLMNHGLIDKSDTVGDRSLSDYANSQQIDYSNESLIQPDEKTLESNFDHKNFIYPKPVVTEAVAIEMKYLFKNTRYFLIKSTNHENVYIAKQKVNFISK